MTTDLVCEPFFRVFQYGAFASYHSEQSQLVIRLFYEMIPRLQKAEKEAFSSLKTLICGKFPISYTAERGHMLLQNRRLPANLDIDLGCAYVWQLGDLLPARENASSSDSYRKLQKRAWWLLGYNGRLNLEHASTLGRHFFEPHSLGPRFWLELSDDRSAQDWGAYIYDDKLSILKHTFGTKGRL